MAKAASKQVVQEVVAQDFEVGSMVTFVGFSDPNDAPDNADLLEEGEVYKVAEVVEPEDDQNEVVYKLEVPNPNFDAKKRPSAANPKTINVEVFGDEIEESEEAAEEQEEAAPPAKTTRGKAAGKATAKAEPAKAEAEELDFDAVDKGAFVTVIDKDGEVTTGMVLKKGRAGITVEDTESGEARTFKEDDVESLTEAEEPKAKEAPKAKAGAKGKASGKATAAKAEKGGSKLKGGKATKAPKEKEPKEEEDEDLKGLIILTEEEEDKEILELIEDADITELAEDLAQESASAEYKLGGVLYHVRIGKAFREIHKGKYNVKGGFQQYVEQELRLGYRKAMYLIDIYTKFNKFGLDPDTVAEIGWSKAMSISSVMDEKNAEELVELAKEQSAADLKETIKESFSKKGEDNREVVRKTTFKFKLVESQGAIVADLLQQAAQQLGSKKLDDAFEHIITEWAAEHLDVATTRKAGKRGK